MSRPKKSSRARKNRHPFPQKLWGDAMADSHDTNRQLLEEFRSHLETLAWIHVDPRVRTTFGMSDIIQDTLLEAWLDLDRIAALDVAARKRRLRQMLMHNLLDALHRWRAGQRDVRLEKSLETAAEASSCRLRESLTVEATSSGERLAAQEEALRLLEALARLNRRQREALVLQKYHGWTLAQIAGHLGCTVGAVAGLHARGLKKLRQHLKREE
jgi:RNA polymerase sigma-70 factor (subfamily 1)